MPEYRKLARAEFRRDREVITASSRANGVLFLHWDTPNFINSLNPARHSREHLVGVRFRSVIGERHSNRDMARVAGIIATLEVWPSALSQSPFESTIGVIHESCTAIRAEEA